MTALIALLQRCYSVLASECIRITQNVIAYCTCLSSSRLKKPHDGLVHPTSISYNIEGLITYHRSMNESNSHNQKIKEVCIVLDRK
jgi:hypothetical protein